MLGQGIVEMLYFSGCHGVGIEFCEVSMVYAGTGVVLQPDIQDTVGEVPMCGVLMLETARPVVILLCELLHGLACEHLGAHAGIE